MGFNATALRASEGIIDSLGDPVEYVPLNSPPKDITAVVDRTSGFYETEGGRTFRFASTITLKETDAPHGEAGDCFIIDERMYEALTFEPDGLGIIDCRLSLRRNTE